MSKYVLIPDSFKGSLSSKDICAIMEEVIHARDPNAIVSAIPVSDGGEGCVDCFLTALSGERVKVRVMNPFFEEMDASYAMLPGGETAVIEMAACAGLLLAEGRKNPLVTTTYGVGQLIRDAALRGVKHFILGLGGSATNDGGCGAAAALGVRFYDIEGSSFVPVGGSLINIAKIDTSDICQEIRDAEFTVMCDIDNPMYGESGAAMIYGPQKGADETTVKLLDRGVRYLADIILRDVNRDVAHIPGSGAAGAMGAGMIAFFNAELKMGIDVVLDTVSFDDIVRDADMVFTGEGKIDTQSLRGKVAMGVARRAKKFGVPVTVLVGEIGDGIDRVYDEGVTSIFSINRSALPLYEALKKAPENLKISMDNVMRLMLLQQNY